ncbi:MAG TPA: sulfite exporter TauE/SafE family protein [Planctomycetaceae bacterium]|nr:sulfite exporter TauE/SafE family protein [Planctomycetaceae bacterium]
MLVTFGESDLREIRSIVDNTPMLDTPTFYILLVLIGAVTGALTGLTGASGMSVLISALLLVGLNIRDVIGLTFAVTLANAATSLPAYWRKGNINLRVALWLSIPAMAAVPLGHAFGGRVESNGLTAVIVVCLFAIGLKFVISTTGSKAATDVQPATATDDKPKTHRTPTYALVPLGILLGTMMGVMGGGGAVFIGAGLILLFRMPARMAIGTSVFIMGLVAIPGVFLHLHGGTLEWAPAAAVLASSIPVAALTSNLAHRISEVLIKRLLGIYLLFISLFLLSKLLS